MKTSLSLDISDTKYVKRVKRAADHLAAKGSITHDDRKALIAAAEDEPLPEGIMRNQPDWSLSGVLLPTQVLRTKKGRATWSNT